MKLLAEVSHDVADQPFDEDAARFWSWVDGWRDAEGIELDRRIAEQKAVVARMGLADAETVGRRTQTRLDQIVRRADG